VWRVGDRVITWGETRLTAWRTARTGSVGAGAAI
jgi:hypothetical protein